MKVSASVLLAAALGVSAHPSGHGHKHAHRSVEARADFVMAAKPVIPAPEPTTTSVAPPPPPPTTTSVAPPPAKTTTAAPKVEETTVNTESTDSSSSGSTGGSSKAFCGGKSNRKRATLGEIAYTGNVGTSGDYGCNMMMVDSASGYDYTSTFTNVGDDSQTCVCWLKIGPLGLINGFFTGNEVLTFDLPAGSSKVLAAEANTQGGCACGHGEVPLSGNGQFASTWYEFDYANESNNGWSGMDISSIVPAAEGMTIAGMKCCDADESTCSTIYPGGKTDNAFGGGDEAKDGLGLNIPAGSAHIKVDVNYSG